MEAETASQKPAQGHDRNPDNVVEQPPRLGVGAGLCAFFLTITLAGVVLIHPLMRRAIHSERQVNDVVIFAAANYGSSTQSCSAF